jgi:radical SAM-linked protein
MVRAVKRAALPVWHTEGFNPHIYMTFALPLALGIESSCESFDLRLTTEMTFDEITGRLNAVMPEGLFINHAAEPVRKANDIEKARYVIETTQPSELETYFAQPQILITKKTKKNTVTIDVKPHLNREADVLTLPAGNTFNINLWNVLNGITVENVRRVGILCSDGQVFE